MKIICYYTTQLDMIFYNMIEWASYYFSVLFFFYNFFFQFFCVALYYYTFNSKVMVLCYSNTRSWRLQNITLFIIVCRTYIMIILLIFCIILLLLLWLLWLLLRLLLLLCIYFDNKTRLSLILSPPLPIHTLSVIQSTLYFLVILVCYKYLCSLNLIMYLNYIYLYKLLLFPMRLEP
jgi:hypothetical protein